MIWNHGFITRLLNVFSIMWKHVSSPCHFCYLFEFSEWRCYNIHKLYRCVYFLYWVRLGIFRIIWRQSFTSCVVLWSTAAKKTIFFLQLYSRYVSGVVFLIDYSPCCFMCRCPIIVFIYFSRWFLINPYVMPGYVLRKTLFITLRKLVVFGLNRVEWKYCDNNVFVVGQ